MVDPRNESQGPRSRKAYLYISAAAEPLDICVLLNTPVDRRVRVLAPEKPVGALWAKRPYEWWVRPQQIRSRPQPSGVSVDSLSQI